MEEIKANLTEAENQLAKVHAPIKSPEHKALTALTKAMRGMVKLAEPPAPTAPPAQ